MTEKPASRVVRVSDDHIGALTRFVREVWDPEATEASVRLARRIEAERNPATPGQESPTYLFLREERAIGHLGTIPARLSTPSGSLVAYWLKGLWVVPEYRSGPIGPLLVKEAATQLDRLLSLAVAPAARRVLTGLGFADLGSMTDYVRPLRSLGLVKSLAQPADDEDGLPMLPPRLRLLLRAPGAAVLSSLVLDLGTALVAATLGRAPKRVVASPGPDIRAGADRIWEGIRGQLNGTLRDGRHFDWRFSDPSRYASLVAGTGDAPLGIAVLRQPREGGDLRSGIGRMASIVDIAFSPRDAGTGLRLVQDSLEYARSFRADAVLCGASHPALKRVLLRAGFLSVGGRVHLLVRERGEVALPRALANWWLTRADGGADDGL